MRLNTFSKRDWILHHLSNHIAVHLITFITLWFISEITRNLDIALSDGLNISKVNEPYYFWLHFSLIILVRLHKILLVVIKSTEDVKLKLLLILFIIKLYAQIKTLWFPDCPADIYFVKVKKGNIKTICEICLK